MKKNLLSILLALVLVLGLTVLAAPAVSAEETTAHTHCYCINADAKPEDHVCSDNQEWTAITATTTISADGYYFLDWTGNKAASITVAENVTASVCLNGARIYAKTTIVLNSNATLNICDCSNGAQGSITVSASATRTPVYLGENTAVNLYSGNITGTGNGKALASVTLAKATAVFNMYGGSITGGSTTTNGGNVLISAGSFTMYGGTIENGHADKKGGNIALTAASSSFTMYGGTVSGGEAGTFGGNISANNGAQVLVDGKDALITNGKSTSTTDGQGGGNVHIHKETGKFTLNAGTISNGAALSGGNIMMEAGTFEMNGGAITGGTAGKNETEQANEETGEITTIVTYSGIGGNVYVKSGALNVNSGSISGGIAKNGGNIYADANGTVNMTDVLLENGISIENGGNIYAVSGSTCTLNSGTISGGTAKSGGNIFTKGTLNIADGEITSGSTSATGGNIRVDGTGSKLNMTGGIVSNGLAADNGGNIYVIDCTQAKITGGQVLNGESGGAQGGGNLYVTHQKATTTRFLTLSKVTISGGKATAGNGGNIYARALGKLTMTDVTVENGSATKNGDNVYLQDNINVDITGGTFTATYGGRNYVYDEAKHKSYTQEQIETYGINYAGGDAEKTGNGGNISIYNCGKITETTTTTDETTGEEVTNTTVTATGYVNITGSTIIGGQAENGGAIYVGSGTLTLDGVTAKSCGGESGKVLHIAKNGTATVKDSTLINWGIQGSTIVNNGNLILQGNISMPKEYNANEIVVIGLSNTQDILIKCSENANAVMDISELTSVDTDVINVEGIYYGDGVLSVGRSENVNADGDTLNTAGLVANGVNDTNRALIVAYNAAFDLTETDCSYYLVNALIQGVTENGNLTGGGANFDDVTNDGKTSVVYYILNGDLTENAGTIGKDICLNLNGYTVTGATVAQGVKVELMDSANDGYDATKCGSFSGTVNGTVESIVHVNIPGGSRHYVILPNDDGSYSAHRYLAFISHTSLKPAQAALGFKATFRGDEKVRAAATGYGLNMRVNSGNAKEFMKASTEWTAESTTVSLRVQNMLVEGSDAICKAGASAVVYGDAFILFEIGGGNVYATTSEKGVSLKGFIKSLNTDLVANPDNYNATQITAVQTLINNFGAYMEGWEYDAIMAWAESSEEPVPETTEAA